MKQFMLRVTSIFLLLLLSMQTVFANANTVSDARYAEGARLFEAFMDVVAHIEDNPDVFATIHLLVRPNNALHIRSFERFAGGTEEEWQAKTPMERFVLRETYLRPLTYLALDNFDRHFGSERNFINNTIRSPLEGLNRDGDGSEAEVFKQLMLWQYNYIIDTGAVFNFITGESHQAIAIAASPEAPDSDDEYDLGLTDEEREELDEALAELDERLTPAGNERQGMSWIFIVLIVILGIGLIGVIVFVKRK